MASVTAIVADWSGTLADPYVLAPAKSFVETFRRHGVDVTMTEARGPMGLKKDLHIRRMCEDPAIADRWTRVHGAAPAEADIAALYADFVPLQLQILRDHATLLPGIAETMTRLQAQGLKIAATTGFTAEMIEILTAAARTQGFTPDATSGGDEVRHGARPMPHMLFRCLDLMGIDSPRRVIKADDTASGMGEGRNAGAWCVGVARYANDLDIDTLEQGDALTGDDLARRMARVRARLWQAGAHYVIDSLAEIEPVIADVNRRLARGERP